MNTIRRLSKPIKIAVILLTFGFVLHALYRNVGQVKEAIAGGELSLKLDYLALSYVCLAVFLISRSLLWHYITLCTNAAIDLRKAIVSWMVSLLGKNIPGKVFLLAGRVYLYGQHGVGAGRVTLSFMLEVACSVAAAMLILLGCLITLDFPDAVSFEKLRWLLAAGLVVILFLLHPKALQWLFNLGLSKLKREPAVLSVRYRDILFFVIVSCINWLLLGIGFFLMVRSLVYLDWGLLPFVTGSFAFALVAGLLAVFAPAGLGVREGILMALLNAVMPVGIAALVALVARLWIMIGETSGAGLALAADHLWPKRFQGVHDRLPSKSRRA